MSIVKIKDKTFQTSITESEIKQRVKELAAKLSNDLKGKNPLLLGVLIMVYYFYVFFKNAFMAFANSSGRCPCGEWPQPSIR